MIAYGYDDNGYYTGEKNCQIDPLESKRKGEFVYLLPANATWDKPLDEKEGYRVRFVGGAWTYEEIPEPQPAPEPTQEEKEEMVRAVRNGYLSSTDFTQLDDAPFTPEQKASYAEYRQYLRDYTKQENWWEQNPATYEEWETAHHPVNE